MSPLQSSKGVRDEVCTRTHTPATTPGFKLVIDNVDSTVKPRYMREDAQNLSLHYVQMYAVEDRVDYSSLPD